MGRFARGLQGEQGGCTMTQLLVHFSPNASNEPCPLCGQALLAGSGPQLVLAETSQPVCHTCGRKHAPPLVALLHLGEEARRVGRIGRHTVVPPYTALLDLARAADDYISTLPAPAREAG